MNKKVIFFVTNEFRSLYKFRLDIIRLFKNKNFDIHILGQFDGHEQKFRDIGISKLHNIPFSGRSLTFKSNISAFLKLFNIYRINKPNFSFQYTIKPSIYGAIISKIFNIPNVIMITGISYFLTKSNLFTKIAIFIMKRAYSGVDEIFFTNTSDVRVFRELKILHTQKYSIIPGAGYVYQDNMNYTEKSEKINFLLVGRLVKEKGVEEYINAAMKYSKNKNINFTLVGSYNNDKHHIDKNLLEQSIEDNSIFYYDFMDNIDYLYTNASCFVLPSYKEGMSTVLFEAISFGIPIITTNVPGCIDIIPDTEHGFICKPKDLESLEKCIIEFLESDSKHLKKITYNAHVRCKKYFNRKDILDKYLNILNKIS